MVVWDDGQGKFPCMPWLCPDRSTDAPSIQGLRVLIPSDVLNAKAPRERLDTFITERSK